MNDLFNKHHINHHFIRKYNFRNKTYFLDYILMELCLLLSKINYIWLICYFIILWFIIYFLILKFKMKILRNK